jgi:hypothetical protein
VAKKGRKIATDGKLIGKVLIYIYIYICVCVCVCVCVYIYICTCARAHTHIYYLLLYRVSMCPVPEDISGGKVLRKVDNLTTICEPIVCTM